MAMYVVMGMMAICDMLPTLGEWGAYHEFLE